MDYPYRWAIQWRQQNKLDGYREHFIWDWRDPDRVVPMLFKTRREARAMIADRYGYIKNRPDLQAEPHGWKMPRVIKVKVELKAPLDKNAERG